jgi:acyl-CoA reductase-like NAD-dependent aldehyde dehydrogenase
VSRLYDRVVAVEPSSTVPELLESIDPRTFEPVGSVVRTSPGDVDAVVAASGRAQAEWARTALAERARLLARLRRVLVHEMDELAAVVAAETGKPLAEAYAADLVVAADNTRWLERPLESVSYAAGQAPWGGVKESGLGRTHSRHGLYECVRVKYADRDAGRVPVPWWLPYDEGAAEGFRAVLDVLYGDGVRAVWRRRAGVRWLGRRLRGA